MMSPDLRKRSSTNSTRWTSRRAEGVIRWASPFTNDFMAGAQDVHRMTAVRGLDRPAGTLILPAW